MKKKKFIGSTGLIYESRSPAAEIGALNRKEREQKRLIEVLGRKPGEKFVSRIRLIKQKSPENENPR